MPGSLDDKLQIAVLSKLLLAQGLRLGAAESCTGGLLAKVCTDYAGSSAWFEGSLVTYSNEAKHSVLGVSMDKLERCGAVSGQVVREMVQAVFKQLPRADIATAVSGIAGPSGATEDKPVGLVWIAWQLRDHQPTARRFRFTGDRDAVRQAAAHAALAGVTDLVRRAQKTAASAALPKT